MSEEAGEGSMENTGEGVSLGKVEKHMSLEEKQVKTQRNFKVLGLQSCYYVPTPKDLDSLWLADAVCLGFSHESPDSRGSITLCNLSVCQNCVIS